MMAGEVGIGKNLTTLLPYLVHIMRNLVRVYEPTLHSFLATRNKRIEPRL